MREVSSVDAARLLPRIPPFRRARRPERLAHVEGENLDQTALEKAVIEVGYKVKNHK